MKKIFLILTIILLALEVYAQNTQSMGIVYNLGIFTSQMSDGVVVGNGQYVLTNKNAVFEKTNQKQVGPVTKNFGHINNYPLFLSNETGDIYECKTVAVIEDSDLALLKLPVKLKYTNHIEEKLPNITVGTYEVLPKGKKFLSTYIGLDRNDESGEFFIKKFDSKTGLLEKGIDDSKIYMCDVDKNYLLPGGMLICKDKFYGILNVMTPLVDLNVKPAKEYMGGMFSLAQYVLPYCKDKEIPFENTETVSGKETDKLDLLNQVNFIISRIKLSEPEKAIEAIKKYPLKDTSYYINILEGMTYESMGDTFKAFESYEKATKIAPEEAYAQIRIANLKKDKITVLNELGLKYKDDFRIFDRLARSYAQQNNFEMARSFISRALIFSPQDSEMILEKAKYEKELKNHKGVMDCISDLNDICPKYTDALEFETVYYIENNNIEAAFETCNTWLKLTPNSPNAIVYMAKIYFMNNEIDLGKEYLSTAKDKNPNEDCIKLIKEVEEEFIKETTEE